MKRLCWFLLWAFTWGSLKSGEIPVEVRMLNGDLFSGTFRDFDAGYFRVIPAWGGEPLRFHAAYTGGMRVYTESPITRTAPDTRVRFVNGDRISGRLLSLSDRELVLQSWWGGEMRAHREFIESLEILPGEESLIFRGLAPLADWSVLLPQGHEELTEPQRKILLPENSRISRSMPLPESGGVLFEAEISFPSGGTVATLDFFQTTGQTRPAEGISLSLNQNWMHVRMVDGNGRQVWVLREALPLMIPGEPILVAVHLNVRTAEVTVRINEMEYPSFSLYTERALPGRDDLQWVLQPGRESGGMRLHHVEFTRVPGVYAPDLTVEDSSKDLVVFGNGDRMAAGVVSMDTAEVRLTLEGDQRVSVPRDRIRWIRLATRASIHPRRRNRDVTVALAERGDILTLAFTGFDARGISGTSDLWGDIPAIPPGAVREVRFNIYQHLRHDHGNAGMPMFLFER